MSFKLNPFTDKLDQIGPGGSSTGTVETLTGNIGGAISPDGSGNIDILGVGNVSVSGAGNTLLISDSSTSISWSVISASQTMAVNSGYICIAPGGALALLLPLMSAVGDLISVTLDGATSFQITQSAGQSIRFGMVATTAGVGGSITTTQQGDTITLVCQEANLRWNAISSIGNLIVV